MKLNNTNLERKPLSLMARLAACLLIAGCLAGCGRGPSGTYTGQSMMGPMTVEFKGGSKAFVSVMGQTRELAYTVEGNKVIFDTGKGKEVYTIQKDGSLSSGDGMMSVTLTRK